MQEILEPAIRIAKEGVPQHEVNARSVCLIESDCGMRLMGSGKRARGLSRRCRTTGESESGLDALRNEADIEG